MIQIQKEQASKSSKREACTPSYQPHWQLSTHQWDEAFQRWRQNITQIYKDTDEYIHQDKRPHEWNIREYRRTLYWLLDEGERLAQALLAKEPSERKERLKQVETFMDDLKTSLSAWSGELDPKTKKQLSQYFKNSTDK